jgi:hypothetical protein
MQIKKLKGSPPDQLPSAGGFNSVDSRLQSPDAHGTGRDSCAWAGKSRRLNPLRNRAHSRESWDKTDHIHQIGLLRVELNDLFDIEVVVLGHESQVRPAFPAIMDRNFFHGPRRF